MTGIQVEESRWAGVRLEGDQGLAATAANHLLCKKKSLQEHLLTKEKKIRIILINLVKFWEKVML